MKSKTEKEKTPAKTKVRRSQAGLGLFAAEDIKKGTFVIEYVGPIMTNAEADRKGGKYQFEVSKTKTIDGSSRKNKARYANHSCRPNSEIDIKKSRVYISAIKNIRSGEEITYDYGKDYFNHFIKPYGCKCEKCRSKTITNNL